MAVVFYDGTTQVVGVSQVTDEIMNIYAGSSVYDFEDAENSGLYDDIVLNMPDYTVVAGELQKSGSPVSVAGEGDEAYSTYLFREDYITAKNFLETSISDWATMNDAAKQQWVLDHMDEIFLINLRTLQAIKWLSKR